MAAWPYNTQRWQRLRTMKLADEPLCEACATHCITRVAEHVDHRVAISNGGPAFPELEGLASLCGPCHSAKTYHVDRMGKASVPTKGCNADGSPRDPSRRW